LSPPRPTPQPSLKPSLCCHDLEPLPINVAGSWLLRPNAFTRIPNLFPASDDVQTNTDLATMEGATEAARRTVNCILDATGSAAPKCEIRVLHEPKIPARRGGFIRPGAVRQQDTPRCHRSHDTSCSAGQKISK